VLASINLRESADRANHQTLAGTMYLYKYVGET